MGIAIEACCAERTPKKNKESAGERESMTDRGGIMRAMAFAFICVLVIAAMVGCENQQSSLEKEMSLVIKAGKGELSVNDKEDLKKSNHPLLMQISDPNTSKLITIFSNLPTSSHNELLEKGYLKWKFSNLDQQRQQIWRDIVQINIDMAAKQGVAPNPSFSQAALQSAHVGYAVVDIPQAKMKVVSWYILWPEGPPTWVTIVGGKAAGSQPYFNAHLIQLSLLRDKQESRLPA
jgi:hypothetical protein